MAMAAGLILAAGCETESASDNDVRISPRTAALRVNQTQEFRASGGYEYTWSLSDNSIGLLTTTKGAVTVYINRSNPGFDATGPAIQTLTVTSTPRPDGSFGGTNGASFVKTAEAIIEHLPSAVSTNG